MIKLFDDALRLIFFPVRWANAVTTWIQNVCSPDDSLKIMNTCSPKEGDSLKLTVNMQRIYEGVKTYFEDFWITPDKLGEALDESCDKKTIIREGGRYKLAGDVAVTAENTYDDQTGTAAEKLARAQALAETAPEPDKFVDEVVTSTNTAKKIADNLIALIGTSEFAARADHRHKLTTEQGTAAFRPAPTQEVPSPTKTSTMPDDTGDSDFPSGAKYQLKTDTWVPNDADGFSKLEISRIEHDEDNGIHYLYYREVKYAKNGNPISVSAELGAVTLMA